MQIIRDRVPVWCRPGFHLTGILFIGAAILANEIAQLLDSTLLGIAGAGLAFVVGVTGWNALIAPAHRRF